MRLRSVVVIAVAVIAVALAALAVLCSRPVPLPAPSPPSPAEPSGPPPEDEAPPADPWLSDYAPFSVEAPGYVPATSKVPEIRLSPAREVRVLVTDAGGRPVPGATLVASGGRRAGPWRAEAVTDAAGTATVHVAVGREEEIRVRHEVRGNSSIACPEGATTVAIVLRPPEPTPPPERDRSILVLDEAGAPLAGAWCEVDGERFLADGTGRIRTVDARDYVVGAVGRETVDFPSWDAPTEVRLRPSVPLRVRFVDDAGRRLPGGQVRVGDQFLRTDVEGRLVVTDLPLGERMDVYLDLPGLGDYVPSVTVAEAEAVIRLPARGRLRVDLHGEAEGWPQVSVFRGRFRSGAEILLGNEGYELQAFLRVEPDHLELDLPVGTVGLHLLVPPGLPRVYEGVEIRAGETTRLVYDFPRLGRITGRVLGADGEPVADATISLAATEAELGETDEKGRFRLERDPREFVSLFAVGSYRLRIDDYEHAPLLTDPVDLAVDQEMTLRLKRPGLVRIRLLGPDGQPVEGEVWIGSTEDAWDCDGSVTLDELPIGRVRLGARREDGEAIYTEVEVLEGGETSVTIRVP